MNLIISIFFILGSFGNSKSHFGNFAPNDFSRPDSTFAAEKVYLHIDRDYYSPGDDIWFKSYVIDAKTNKLSSITRNLHVELISTAARIIQSRVLRIEGGTGSGDFQLNDSVPSGRYTIRAYTNFMRNFDEGLFFNKEIVVVNPYDNGGNELKDSLENIRSAISITFFPEGGSLVADVGSIVAFKAVNAPGKGCDATGEVYSSMGEKITSFKSTHLGMGSFELKPTPGLRYYAIIRDNDGNESKADIPKPFSTGVAIHVLVLQDKKILFTVLTNEKSLPAIINKELTVTLSSRNLFSGSTKIKPVSLVSNFIIPVEDLPDGVIKVTLSGIDGVPLCERLFFLQKRNNVLIRVKTDKQLYKPREEVKMEVSLAGDFLQGENAFLSLSAIDTVMISGSSIFPASITSWFLLESDIHGPVENPSYYFDFSNPGRFEDLDLLLLTQGWRDFRWKYDSTKLFRHENGFSISGRVRRPLVNKPIAGTKINIGIFNDEARSYLLLEPDSSGRFIVDGIDIKGKARIIATITGKNEKLEGWIILDSMMYIPPDIKIYPFRKYVISHVEYAKRKQEVTFISAIRKKYKLSDTISIGEVIVTAEKPDSPHTLNLRNVRSLYGSPDRELILTTRMEHFGNSLEMAGMFLPGAHYNGKVLIVRGTVPFVMVDGIEADWDFVAHTPANIIERVDYVYIPVGLGLRGANGVINFITKRGEVNTTVKPVLHSVNISIPGYDAPRIFYSPNHSNPEMTAFLPDTRSTIFWEPNILTGKSSTTLNFFNADKATTIEVKVEGITSEGIPVTGKLKYAVK